MNNPIVAKNLGKKFFKKNYNKPRTLRDFIIHGPTKSNPENEFWGLRNVGFEVRHGQIFGVIGKNGAGKSTLLRILGGILRPDEGTVEVRGRIGALLELGTGFQPDLSGKENVYINGVLSGLSRKEISKQFESIVEFAEISEFINSPLRTYSSGMAMRLAFSIAIHINPEVLLIDEVLAVGDMSFRKKCIQKLADFKKQGCTIFIVSHDLHQLENFCDEILWLSNGKVCGLGPPKSVIKKYVSEMHKETQKRTPSKPNKLINEKVNLILSENRFGSQEVEIKQVKIVNEQGVETTELNSGCPLKIEIKYVAQKLIHTPIFSIAITNKEKVKYFNANTLNSGDIIEKVHGPGKISLNIDRLDLNSGKYFLSVGIYEKEWSYAYDYHWQTYPLIIHSKQKTDGIISTPFRWDF